MHRAVTPASAPYSSPAGDATHCQRHMVAMVTLDSLPPRKKLKLTPADSCRESSVTPRIAGAATCRLKACKGALLGQNTETWGNVDSLQIKTHFLSWNCFFIFFLDPNCMTHPRPKTSSFSFSLFSCWKQKWNHKIVRTWERLLLCQNDLE